MSVKTKTASVSEHFSPFIIPQQETARCAISEDGELIYANSQFYDLIDRSPQETLNAREIFNLDKTILPAEKNFSALPSGEYNIRFDNHLTTTEFRFDWINNSDGTRTLIASARDEFSPAQPDEDFTSLLKTLRSEISIGHAIPEPEFSQFITMSHDIMVITDTHGTILNLNPAFSKCFSGDKPDLLIGTNFIDLFYDDDKHQARRTLQSLIHAGESALRYVTFEMQMLGDQGQVRWIEWRQKYQNNKVYACGRDITDIRKKHNDLVRRQRQLSEAEAIGRMGHWHWMIGQDNIAWSEEIYRIFGVDQNHFKPCLNKMTDLIHKRDIGRVVQVFQRAIIEEKNYNMEFRIIRPGGEVRYIQCEGRCEKDETGDVIALYGIMQDLTERVMYEEELKEAKNASEQANIAKSQFLANMSHELRTPLNAIIGFSEMMENQMLGPMFNEKYLEYARNIRESGAHLLDLISDILDMSKIEAGKYTLDPEHVSLRDTLTRALQMTETRAIEKGVRVRIPPEETGDVTLIADRRGLLQIFLNLLSNAIKFTPKSGSVWIEYQKSEGSLLLKVCDNGIGIPPNKLACVLRPFEQASVSYTRDHEGTGLGLSITKELVSLHGGTLHIESTQNIGTTVHIRLPLAD